MSRRLVVVAAVTLWAIAPWGVARASAQERATLDLSTAVANVAAPGTLSSADQLPANFARPLPPRHSALMTGLYMSTVAMQALDVHSTLSAFGAGAVEANPLMTGVARNKLAFIALKAGVATSTVLAAHNMAKTNKLAAIATLVAINSAYAMIVEHNYKVAQHLR
jgi:Domain of unknown function (DUF5658)